jgi:hypothetical protein
VAFCLQQQTQEKRVKIKKGTLLETTGGVFGLKVERKLLLKLKKKLSGAIGFLDQQI